MDAAIHDRPRRATIAVTAAVVAAGYLVTLSPRATDAAEPASYMLPADAGPALTGPPGISPDTQFTPVAGLVLTRPAPVKASDGKVHIAYELVVTNALHIENAPPSKWISTLSR